MKESISTPPTTLDNAFNMLRQEIVDGLRHGFFELTVSCEIITAKKRNLTIKAGKSHRFTISEDQLTR